MKIVYISLFREGQGGGEGRVAHELAYYSAFEHDVVLICPGDKTGVIVRDSGLRIYGIRSAGSEEYTMPALSGKKVRLIFDFLEEFQPDIVHAHEPASLGLIGQVWAKMHLVPFVHTSHILPEKIFNFGAADALAIKALQSPVSEAITRRALKNFYGNCDAIIALNHSAKKAFREFGYQGRIIIIPNGRDLKKYTRLNFADPEESTKKLTFIGHISDRKNQKFLVDAMNYLPKEIQLQLIGKDLDPRYAKKLKTRCESQNLNVVFAGQTPHEDIPRILESTHIFVSASKMEVQSLVVIEALASGTPVVGLANETIDELIDGRVGIRLSADATPHEFAEQIERVFALSVEDYRLLCAQAREKVSHLNWGNVIEKTVVAYQALKEEKHATRDDSDILADLVDSLPSGEFKEVLEEQLHELQAKTGLLTRLRETFSPRQRWKAIKRVKGSTWILVGVTILVSLVGYLLGKKNN